MPISLLPGKHKETGRDLIMAQINVTEVMDPLDVLRILKKQFPQLWQQVNLEMILPTPPQTSRINGKNA